MKNTKKYMTTIKLGSKGQLVIPKEVREMFNINYGDTILLMADTKQGIAILPYDSYKNIADSILGKAKHASISEEVKND